MKPLTVKEDQFNEIVFENRNKDYGAYSLRTSYKKRMLIAMSVSFTAFLLAVSYPLIAGYFNNSHPIIENKSVDVDMYNHPNNANLPVPPPPLPPPPKDMAEKYKPKTIIVEGNENTEVNLPDQEKVINKPIDTSTSEIPPVDTKNNKPSILESKPEIFVAVEEMPTYPGGDDLRIKFISDNIVYPSMAKESNIQGTVYVTFVVETDGSITDVKILRGIGGGCDEEALRVVKMMPKWNAGKQSGKSVRVQFNLPIKFILQ